MAVARTLKRPAAKRPPTPVEPEPDEALVDKKKVLTNRTVLNSRFRNLVPIDGEHAFFEDDPKKETHRVLIDVDHYQRGRSAKVEDIKAVLRGGGLLPDTKTVVLRPDGTIAIVDGGQSFRALAESMDEMKGGVCSLMVRVHEFDSVALEAELFCVLNDVSAVHQAVQIRAHGGATSMLLRAANVEQGGPLVGKIWTPTGATPRGPGGGISPVALVRSLGTVLLEADDHLTPDWSGTVKGLAVLLKTQQTAVSDILPQLDRALAGHDAQERAQKFLELMGLAFLEPQANTRKKSEVKPYHMGNPNFIACQALGLLMRHALLTRPTARKLSLPRHRKQVHAMSLSPANLKHKDRATNWRRTQIRNLYVWMSEVAAGLR